MKNKKYIVKNDTTLLKFLLENIDGKSKNNIKNLLKNKKIKVNTKIITKFDFILKEKDIVIIDYGFDYEMDKRLNIIYEDDYLIAIDKPAGLLSIGTEKDKTNTAYYLLSDYAKKKNKSNKIFVVHRLDKDTSGVILFAKNEKTKKMMQDNWEESVLERAYIAIVSGKINKSGTIKNWLKENKINKVYSSNKQNDGKLAITHYKVLKEKGNYNMLELYLETGRKNQIRVHMRDLNAPVLGDKKYGSIENPLKRMALHANRLKFIHPITKKEILLTAKTPKIFNIFMR